MDPATPSWIIGDLHGDLLALEAALAQIRAHSQSADGAPPRIIFLGDFVDDEGFGLEVLLRVFELIVAATQQICVIAGNHDEALSYDGSRFASGVSPSDFADFLNANLAHEWIERAGKVALRLTAHAPRALFFPDGLLVAHGGFPLADLQRCPNCGTAAGTAGECGARHEAQVRPFCTNHAPHARRRAVPVRPRAALGGTYEHRGWASGAATPRWIDLWF